MEKSMSPVVGHGRRAQSELCENTGKSPELRQVETQLT